MVENAVYEIAADVNILLENLPDDSTLESRIIVDKEKLNVITTSEYPCTGADLTGDCLFSGAGLSNPSMSLAIVIVLAGLLNME